MERPEGRDDLGAHPQRPAEAVPNSFAEWMNAADYDFVITHPEGYGTGPEVRGRGARVEYKPAQGLEGADFVYAKELGRLYGPQLRQVLSRDRAWTVDAEKMALTNNARFMHACPYGKHDRHGRG